MMPELALIAKAPSHGHILLLGHHTVLLEAWHGGDVPLPETDTLEALHIFDETTEYRAVWSEARGRYLESVLTDDTIAHECAEEERMYLSARFGDARTYLIVRDYYAIDEDEAVYLAGYRILGVGGGA